MKLYESINYDEDYINQVELRRRFAHGGEAPSLNYTQGTMMSGSAECEVLSDSGKDDGFLMIRNCYLEQMSDAQLLSLVRNSQKVLEYLQFRRAIERVVFGRDDLLSYSRLTDIEEVYGHRAKQLRDYVEVWPNAELCDMLEKYDQLIAGEHPASGYVYCLTDEQGHYKLGRTRHIDKRIRQLSTQPPFRIRLVVAHQVYDMFETETALHDLFRNWRMNGEWFQLDSKQVQSVVEHSWSLVYCAMRRTPLAPEER